MYNLDHGVKSHYRTMSSFELSKIFSHVSFQKSVLLE